MAAWFFWVENIPEVLRELAFRRLCALPRRPPYWRFSQVEHLVGGAAEWQTDLSLVSVALEVGDFQKCCVRRFGDADGRC